jgi:short-subunit dehydrogenase
MTRRTLTGKRALVTGASSGIGRELAVQLAETGVSLVLVARREAELLTLQESLAPFTLLDPAAQTVAAAPAISVHLVPGDVTDAATRDAALKMAREHLGGLDILINNAGISAHGRFEDASPERLRRIMEVNFFAAAELTRAALPNLREGREPVVVNVGSILGRRGVPFNSEYCASKFALVGWSEAVRAELARDGIDLLVVNPGTTDTEFFEHLIEKTSEPRWKKQKGIPPSAVARATIDAICRRKSEIVVGNRGRLLLWLNRLVPRIIDRRLRRYG